MLHAQKTISFEFPVKLIEKLDVLSSAKACTINQLIIRLLSEKLTEQINFEADMQEGYTANYNSVKKYNKEWDFTLKDGL